MPFPTGLDFDLPGEYLTEIGRIAIEWSHLEHELEEALWVVMRLYGRNRDIAKATTAHIPYGVRMDMLRSISRAIPLSVELVTELDELQTAIDEQQRRRNLVINFKWHELVATQQHVLDRNHQKDELKRTLYEADLDDFGETASDIAVARVRLTDWTNKAFRALLSLR